jgi:Fe2+ transport system protein FeoA
MVDDDDSALLDAMVDLGILPERQITVVGSGPDGLRAQVGARRVVIPPAVAERVFVVAAPVRTSVAEVPDGSVDATTRSQGPA